MKKHTKGLYKSLLRSILLGKILANYDPGKVFDGIHGHINELDAFLFNNIDLIEKVWVRHVVIV